MKFISTPILILSICLVFVNFYSDINHSLPYKECQKQHTIYFDTSRPSYVNKDYIKKQIDKMFNCTYLLTFNKLNEPVDGISYIPLKLIVLDQDLTCEEFALTLAHELVHITQYTSNERYTTFKTFILLYESQNEYFKNIALAYAELDFNGLMPKEYSCAGYIEEYLAENIN